MGTKNFENNNEYNLNADAYSRHSSGCWIKSSMTFPILSSLGGAQGAIKRTIHFITVICLTLMVSTMALAEDTTTTETCADGAGTIITGAVSGHKYCKSNQQMNWWNANAWCDAQNRELVDFSDCACNGTIANCACSNNGGKNCIGGKCPEFTNVYSASAIWSGTSNIDSTQYRIHLDTGLIYYQERWGGNYALCF